MASALFILLAILARQSAGAPSPQPGAEKAARTPPFTIGALRRDGIVSPFAVFDGKRWSAPWPSELGSGGRSMIASTMAGRRVEFSIPAQWWGKTGPLMEMKAWVDGVNRGIVHLTGPVLLRVMCEWRMGLTSDYHSDQPPTAQSEQPYPKDGLAVSGTQPVEAIEMLSAQSPEWGQTAGFIKDEFDKAEQQAAKAYTDWKDPIPRPVRRITPVEVEAMYRAPMDEDGWVAYYVEGVKRYPPAPEDEGCGLVTSAGGWMFVGPNGKRSVKLHANVTYCDRRGVTYMLPLGLIKAQDKSYWAFQLSGYGREGYMVVRPTPKGADIATQYSAAFCPLS